MQSTVAEGCPGGMRREVMLDSLYLSPHPPTHPRPLVLPLPLSQSFNFYWSFNTVKNRIIENTTNFLPVMNGKPQLSLFSQTPQAFLLTTPSIRPVSITQHHTFRRLKIEHRCSLGAYKTWNSHSLLHQSKMFSKQTSDLQKYVDEARWQGHRTLKGYSH